jgi:large subunit ribosomal protein L1
MAKKHGKKYLAALAKVDRQQSYAPAAAVQLVQETAYAKFNGTVEVHVRLGVDPRQADQQVRDTVVLPAGLGKVVRVLAFAEGDAARLAQEAGADFIADDETLAKIQGGWTDFDVAVATPELMGKVGRLGRVLGPRGLMPNPKTGTVVPAADLPRVIREAKAGRVEFRVDKTANLHVPIGKTNFTAEALLTNFTALMEAVKKARPSGAKGVYVRKVVLTSTMGPGIKVDANLAMSAGPEA